MCRWFGGWQILSHAWWLDCFSRLLPSPSTCCSCELHLSSAATLSCAEPFWLALAGLDGESCSFLCSL